MRRLYATGALILLVGLAWWGLAASRSDLRSPPATLQLVDRQERFLGEVSADDRLGFWPLDALPERVVAATLAAEDGRFWSHPGVDPLAVLRAVRQNVTAGDRISGASTVPMQVARLQDPGPRTWPRKALEATTALFLVARHGREAVLAHYLRLAPYGNNVHGVAYAARRYFDKPVEDLSWAEVALLSALPQAPGRMNLYTSDGKAAAVARARRILDVLHLEGRLSPEDHARALQELAALRVPPRPERPPDALHAILRMSRELPAQGGRVRTSLDLPTQRLVRHHVADALTRYRERGAGNAAAVVLDRHTAEIVAYVGSADWYDAAFAGAIDYAATPRSPGSALKPLLFAQALDRGVLGPVEVLPDLRGGPMPIDNADHDDLGPLLPARALGNSRNVPAVDLTLRIGVHQVHGLLRELHLHQDHRPAEHYGSLVALGGLPVTLLDLVGAYTALAHDGRWLAPRWTPAPGGVPEPGPVVFSARSSRRVLRWLADPMARVPSFPRGGHLELPFTAAIKTGTAEDWRDAWAVGVTDRFIVGGWVGHPDWRPMRGLSGYRAGASLLRTLLLALHDEREIATSGFPPPEGAEPVRVCAWSGHLATDRCEVTTAWLTPDEAPHQPCAVHEAGPDGRTRLALDGPLRAWALARGLPVTDAPDDQPPVVQIVSPPAGIEVLRDPEAPQGGGDLTLRAAVDRDVPQVLWYVNGVEVALSDPPYVARWPLEPGEHVIVAEAAGVRSAPVRIFVR